LFQKHFPKQQMSPALAYLYLLNGVMDRDSFTVETIGKDERSADVHSRLEDGAERKREVDKGADIRGYKTRYPPPLSSK
jgi:hypothetical protein